MSPIGDRDRKNREETYCGGIGLKSVLISVRPRHCADIAREIKDLEIRKNKPSLKVPFKCYVYCTKGVVTDPNQLSEVHGEDGKIRKCNGMVFAEFICDKIIPIWVFENGSIQDWNLHDLASACISYEEMANYIGWGRTGYGWHISGLKVYDQPKGIGSFWRYSESGERPCTKGFNCEHKYFDYSENCTACGIDFDGDSCPKMKLRIPPQSWCYVSEA